MKFVEQEIKEIKDDLKSIKHDIKKLEIRLNLYGKPIRDAKEIVDALEIQGPGFLNSPK